MVMNLQKQFGIKSETELLSGTYSKIQKYLCGKNERNDAQDMLGNLVKRVFNEMRKMFEDNLNNLSTSNEEKCAKASAWYIVTWNLNKTSSNPFWGLPWIVSDILSDITCSKKINSFPNKHKCFLSTNEIIFDLNDELKKEWDDFSYEEQKDFIQKLFRGWLNRQKESHCGLWEASATNVDKMVKKILNSFIDDKKNKFMSLETVMFGLFKNLSSHLFDRHNDEKDAQLNILGLAALMALHRLVRTRKVSSIIKTQNDFEEDPFNVETFCLSLKDPKFYEFVRTKEQEFLVKLKGSYVKEITCKVYPQYNSDLNYLMISASGTKKSLETLKNVITKMSFYKQILETLIYINDDF